MKYPNTCSVILAALALSPVPALAATVGSTPTTVDPVAVSTSALARSTAAVLSTGAVPSFPSSLDRAAVLQAVRQYSSCGGSDSFESHAQSLLERFGERVPLAAMNLLVTEEALTLIDVDLYLNVLRQWVRSGALGGDTFAALVAALTDQAETIVIGRTAEVAAEMAPGDLTALRARAVDNLRRELVRALTGNHAAQAVRAVRLALRSESPGVRAEAARVALKQRQQPLRAEVVAMCERDIPIVREVVCPEL